MVLKKELSKILVKFFIYGVHCLLKGNWKVPLILLLPVLLPLIMAEICNSPSPWYQNNSRLQGSVIETFSYSTINVCHEACLFISGCYSINFYRSSKTCELNQGTHLITPNNFTTQNGSEYFAHVLTMKLNTDPVCFSAKGNQYGTFQTPFTGKIYSFRLVHVSGHVGAYPGAAGNWGTKGRFDTVITDNTNKLLSPPVDLVDTTYYHYKLPGRNSKTDPELVLPGIDPPMYVRTGQQFRIWFGEDLKGKTESDNYGTTCTHVYADFKNV